jgi:hypothetical protein
MLSVLKNTTTKLTPSTEYRNTGWEIGGEYATHYPCNPGTMRSIGDTGLEIGKSYVVSFEVDKYVSGSVRMSLGTANGALVAGLGVFTETITCTGNTVVSIFSDGALRLKLLQIYEVQEESINFITVSFYDVEGNEKKWGTEYSFDPEMMITFANKFFVLKNGQLWEQNQNELRNNFFGQQFPSIIKFYSNINPTTVKVFFSLRVQANRAWAAPKDGDLYLPPTEGKQNGMRSRLKPGNFKRYQGDYFADFLRDLDDPRFPGQPLQALFKGALLQGRIMEITLRNDDDIDVVLLQIDVKTGISNYTY